MDRAAEAHRERGNLDDQEQPRHDHEPEQERVGNVMFCPN